MFGNPQDASIHLLFESAPQPSAGSFIEGDGVEKLLLSLLDEADSHGIKRSSAERITSS